MRTSTVRARPHLRLLVIGFSLLFSATCAAADPEEEGGRVTDDDAVVRIPVTVHTSEGPVIFQAELADDEDERTRGMMFRESNAEKNGMLFLFPAEQQRVFWMKNTLISLDIIFIRADRTILGIAANAEPETETKQWVRGQSQFVLEINGGLAAKKGIRAGQKVTFVAPIPET